MGRYLLPWSILSKGCASLILLSFLWSVIKLIINSILSLQFIMIGMSNRFLNLVSVNLINIRGIKLLLFNKLNPWYITKVPINSKTIHWYKEEDIYSPSPRKCLTNPSKQLNGVIWSSLYKKLWLISKLNCWM